MQHITGSDVGQTFLESDDSYLYFVSVEVYNDWEILVCMYFSELAKNCYASYGKLDIFGGN